MTNAVTLKGFYMTTLTSEEIVKMAREAGISTGKRFVGNELVECITIEVQTFAKLVDAKATAREREACALQLDASANQIRSRLGGLTDEDHVCIGVLVYEAKQIRARGTHE